MKYKINLEIKKIVKTKSFLLPMLLSFMLIIISNVQWAIDEYIYIKNCYSVFYKLISFSCNTKGAIVFYWLYPLIASLPYSLWKYYESKKKSDEIIGHGFIKEAIQAFVTGGLIIFIAYMFDFWMLSLISHTTFPVPNGLITGYCSRNIFSEIYYSKPRLFVFIWSILGFCFGGAFSLLCLNISKLLNNIICSYIILLIIYFSEVFISSKINIPSWKDILYADNLQNNSILVLFLNWLSIVLIGIILRVKKE